MQLHLTFSVNRLNLPLSYNSKLHGLIFSLLAAGDADYASEVHGRNNKLFTYGRLCGECRVLKARNEIVFFKKAELEIRSADDKLIQTLLKGCRCGEEYRIGTNTVRLEGCTLENRVIFAESIRARTASPLYYRTQTNNTAFDAELARYKLIEGARRSWTAAGRNADDFCLDIEFEGEQQRVHSQFDFICNNGWMTELVLRGNADTLNFIYNAGLGAKTAEGFGLIEIV